MSKERKDTLITKETTQPGSSSIKPLPELLNLFELVNEIFAEHHRLPSSKMISEKLYSEGLTSRFPEFNDEEFFSEKVVVSLDPMPIQPEKKRNTNEQILEEIKRITKDLPKLYNFLFDDTQDLYPITNRRYEKNTNAEWNEKIEGVFDKYDDIRLFAVNLTQMAAISSFHRNEFGLERFKQIELRQNYYLDMPSSRYYIDKGRFRFELDLFAQHLQGVEAFRVRLCFVCESVFWAYDLREKYCSRKCSNRFSQKKWYSKPDNKEQFLRNKKAEYHTKKGSNRFPSRVKKEEEK